MSKYILKGTFKKPNNSRWLSLFLSILGGNFQFKITGILLSILYFRGRNLFNISLILNIVECFNFVPFQMKNKVSNCEILLRKLRKLHRSYLTLCHDIRETSFCFSSTWLVGALFMWNLLYLSLRKWIISYSMVIFL